MTREVTDKRLVFDGRIVQGYKLRLRVNDETVERELLHYPGAAVVVPVLEDGSVVLIRNERFAVEETLIELPAGNLEPDEDPAVCAARELTEETGYTAGRIERLGSFYTAPGTSDEVLHAFLATDLTAGEQDLEVHEEIRVEIATPATCRRWILDGTLHDAKSISALALHWLREGRV